MEMDQGTVAQRLGVARHVSILLRKVARLQAIYPSLDAECVEDWLLDVANARGARIVTRPNGPLTGFVPPPADAFPNEELVVAICHPCIKDRPQTIRVAAQLISREAVDVRDLIRIAERERAGIVLSELARQALHVAPEHPAWQAIRDRFDQRFPSRGSILHWSRLANPRFAKARPNPVGWSLNR